MFSFLRTFSWFSKATPVQASALSSDKQAQDLDEQRIAWIDRMILMVPEFVRTNQVKDRPIHFFFIYSAQTQTVLYRAESCVCGICFNDGYGILERFSEEDWARFQELIAERLDYFNDTKEPTLAEFRNRVMVVLPMDAIRDTCIAWMLEQDTVSVSLPSEKIPDGHCASC